MREYTLYGIVILASKEACVTREIRKQRRGDGELKEVTYEFDSQKELNKFPYEVRREVAHALYEAQQGGKHNKVKVLVGFQGAGMLEIRDQHGGCAYRVFYTTLIKSRICVLHAIKKKSTRGIATPKNELELIKKRLKETLQRYKE